LVTLVELALDKARLGIRVLKLCILLGVFGLLVEGLFELKLLVQPFLKPASVPGEDKIIEHFAVQHVLFPVLGLALVFWPLAVRDAFASTMFRVLIGCLAVLVTLPEIIVSVRSDLFRPYPFDLHSAWLSAVQMVDIGTVRINLLQAQHLVLSHLCLMGTLLWLSAAPDQLRAFAGPRTGRDRFAAVLAGSSVEAASIRSSRS